MTKTKKIIESDKPIVESKEPCKKERPIMCIHWKNRIGCPKGCNEQFESVFKD